MIDKDECKNKTLHGGVFKHKEKKENLAIFNPTWRCFQINKNIAIYYTYICSSFINDANHDHDAHVFACSQSTLHYEETWAYFMANDSHEMDFCEVIKQVIH